MKEELCTSEINDAIKLSESNNEMSPNSQQISDAYDRLLNRFIPSSVLVDQNRNVLHVFGEAGQLLRSSVGRFSPDLTTMLHGELRGAVISAFQQSLHKNESTCFGAVETIKNNGESVRVEVRVEPLLDDQQNKSLFLVQFIFNTTDSEKIVNKYNQENQNPNNCHEYELHPQIGTLIKEQSNTLQILEDSLKQLESANQNLQSSDERVLPSNHSTQVASNEIETVNKQLYSLSKDHKTKIQILHRVATDLQNLIGASEVDSIFLDHNLRIRTFTPKSAQIFNINANDLGKAFESITSKIQNDDVFSETRRVHEGHVINEKRISLPDGRVFLRRILPYRELDESINGIILTFVDVTALNKAETTAEDYAERVNLVSAAGNFGIWERHLKTNEIIWDAEMFNIYGIKPTHNRKIDYTDWSRTVLPEDLQHQEALIKKSVEGQEMIERKFRIRRRSDNQTRVIMGIETSRKDDHGNIISVVGINRDITEQHAALESDTLLAAIVKNSSDGILTKDLNGKITSWNQGATDILQYEAEEIVGRNIRTLAPKHLQEQGDPISKRIQSGELEADFQTQLSRKDGQLVDVSVSFFPVYNKQKTEVKLIASIIRDITENKRIQSKLRNADKLESLGIMAGGIAHEFNNLLTGILANVSMAIPESNKNSVVKQSLEEIEQSSKYAADLCRQMLAYAGKTDSSLQDINLNELTKNAISSITPSLNKNIKTDTLLPKDPLFIKADPIQIQQVITDLILNASEAVEEQNGQIELKLKRIEATAALLREADESYQLADSPHAVLEIKDNGCGIKEEDLSKIFDPFFSTKFTGRGLGLPAVRGILMAHSGALVVTSTLKIGSTFSVILPIYEPPPITKEKISDKIESKGEYPLQTDEAKVHKCLIIDDQECIRRALSRLLRKNGYEEVLIADDGQTGFEMFKKHQEEIDFVMLDLIMPGWNGAQTLAAIKQTNPEIPVIIMSGYIEDQVNETLETGASPDAFLQKPFDELGLLNALKNVVHS